MKQFRRNIEDIEVDGCHIAAEVLLISLKHIKEHNFSHPIDTTEEEWNVIVDELIWFCEFMSGEELFLDTEEKRERFKNASRLLGKYFADIWC